MYTSFKKIFSLTLVLSLFVAPFVTNAASLFVSPEVGSYSVGKTFSIRVRVSSPQAINAVSGAISFPSDKLQATSVSKAGSILTLWVQDPLINNNAGRISFEGVVPNPGYQGEGGLVVSVTFRVLKSGNAEITFASGAVLANDGNGTDLLTTTPPASYSLVEAPVVEEGAPTAPTTVAPIVETQPETPIIDTTIVRPVSSSILTFVAIAVPLFVLTLVIILGVMHGFHKVRLTNKKFINELRDIERVIDRAFDLLQEDVEDSIRVLERTKKRRSLTDEESEVMKKLKQNLRDAEAIVHSKVKKMEEDME